MAATPRRMSEVARLSLAGRGHSEESAENDDGDFDVQIGPHRHLDGFGEARKDIGNNQAGKQGKNISAFAGQLQRPVDAEFLLFGGCDGGEVRIITHDPARIGNPEDRRKRERKSLHIAFQGRGCER